MSARSACCTKAGGSSNTSRLIRWEAIEITVPQLPQDVVMNILSRLPVKYLIKLKSVCKPWRSLISDPHFAKLQLAQSKKNGNLCCHRFLSFTHPLHSVDFEDFGNGPYHVGHLEYPAMMKKAMDSDYLEIRGSCNGLICIAFSNGRIFLWNPTLREALELPSDGEARGYYIFGLGYDFSTDDYKLVKARIRFTPAKKCGESKVQILSSKSNKRREIEEPGFLILQGPGIFLHGALHWIGIRAGDPKEIDVIVAFDMEKEKFYELGQVPDCYASDRYLTNSGDSLFPINGCVLGLDVWKLNEYGVESSWIKIFSGVAPIPFRIKGGRDTLYKNW